MYSNQLFASFYGAASLLAGAPIDTLYDEDVVGTGKLPYNFCREDDMSSDFRGWESGGSVIHDLR